ncbi:MAG: dTDP-4-dehydrorhamnose 3,5-epimerase family protein [Gammaproteobacteria bacterium]
MNRFEIQKTSIDGVVRIIRNPINDQRGYFERLFCEQELKLAGWNGSIKQINHTHTKNFGTVRGMHYQLPPHAECKLITCIKGKIFDVVVDLRKDSKTFLQTYTVELSAESHNSLLIPEGLAHGFQTLVNDVEMLYLHSANYAPEFEDTLNPIDPALGIDWPESISIISDRDKSKDYISSSFEGIAL